MKLYEKLTIDLINKIETGYYKKHQKLPSLRNLSHQLKVSITTVNEAYRKLEDAGYVVSKNKSGYYVIYKEIAPLVLLQPEQQTVNIEYWKEALELTSTKNTQGFIALGKGGPNTKLKTLNPLQRIYGKMARIHSQEFLNNETGNGYLPLREQIAFLMKKSGCNLHPDDILITTGCQEAISLCLKAITNPGDIIAIDSPSFHGLTQAVRVNELRAIEIPTHPETGINLQALTLALEQWPIKVIHLIPSCNNPIGYIMPDKNKEAVYNLALKHDVLIIEDDIYGDLIYENPRPKTIKSFDTEGKVLLCSSFSKTVSPGMRVGWVVGGEYSKIITHLKFINSLASTSSTQIVMTEFIKLGHYDRHLRLAKAEYIRNRVEIIKWINFYMPEGTKHSNPRGGFQLWVELPMEIDTFVLNSNLNKFNISIAPGPLFSCTDKYANCFRITFVSRIDKYVKNAIKILGEQIQLMALDSYSQS